MDNRPLKIYSKENTPRLSYISGIIFSDILGISIEITTDRRKLGKHQVINYSTDNIKDSLKIAPDSLLFEKGISPKELIITQWKGLPVFFKSSEDSDIPFDIFAASFYLVTRYEEYPVSRSEASENYNANSSIAYKNGFLQTAVIERWTKELAKIMVKKFVTLAFKRNEYNAIITIDADHTFDRRRMNLARTLGELLREFTKKESSDKPPQAIENDPYTAFSYLSEIAGHDSDLRVFFPVGDYSDYNKNPSWKNTDYRRLIRSISGKYKTGLHGSYYASCNRQLLNKEVFRMKEILGREISSGRVNNTRIQMPDSYTNMIEAGIPEDYSMGYADTPGFRAGIARPFYFFDLACETQTSLRIVPFEISDEIYDKGSGPDSSKELIMKLITETRKVGGLFVSVWHNNLLLDNQDCHFFRQLFEFMVINQIP